MQGCMSSLWGILFFHVLFQPALVQRGTFLPVLVYNQATALFHAVSCLGTVPMDRSLALLHSTGKLVFMSNQSILDSIDVLQCPVLSPPQVSCNLLTCD